MSKTINLLFFKYIIFILIFFSYVELLSQEKFKVTGKVIDSVDNKPLPYATISVLGTKFGSYTNLNGEYFLELDKGLYRLAISMTGFETEYKNISLDSDILDLEFTMSMADYQLEDLIVYAEGPGLRLMRKVIQKKIKQSEALESYNYMLYTKFVVATDTLTAGRNDYDTDTTINSILESYSKSYYQKEDKFFNYIIKRRQTYNVPPEANFVSFGNNINVYDDIVEILSEEIYSPFNKNAVDYYEFLLEGKFVESDGRVLHKILVEPKSSRRKLFEGYLIIDSLNLIPTEVVLQPSKAVQLPFNAKLEYRQSFDLFDSTYLMPTSLRIFTNISAEVFLFYKPRLEILLETYQYDYNFNIDIDDRIFNQRNAEADKSANILDSNFWFKSNIIPLREQEQFAYERIRTSIEYPDSIEGTNFFAKTIKPFTDKFRFLNRAPFTGSEDFFKHNRVSGTILGVGLFKDLSNFTYGKIYAGYGLEDEKLNYDIVLDQYFDKYRQFKLGVNLSNGITRSDNPYIVKDKLNTLTSIFGSDAGDYYYNEKYSANIEYSWGQQTFVKRYTYTRPYRISLYASVENHQNAPDPLIKAIGSNLEFRDNPEVIEGRYNLIGLELNLNYSRLRKISKYGLYFNLEHSNNDLGSLLDYNRYYSELYFKVKTFPSMNLTVQSTFGWHNGDLPMQKYFALESGPAIITVPGSFRTIRQKEFYGDKFMTINLEHNFGELFPGLFRIPSVTSFGLEFILMTNIGYSDFNFKNNLRNRELNYNFDFTKNTNENYFYEAGIGLNKLFLFFRFDLTFRLSQVESPRFMFNISGATF